MCVKDPVSPDMCGVQKESVPAGEAHDADGKRAKFQWSKRAAIIVVTLAAVTLLHGTCYALLAPFFPLEAERKGISPSQYSLVFGVGQLVCFLMSPVFGKLLSKHVRAKLMLCTGLLVNGIFCCLMGLLVFSPPGNTFFGLAVAFRALQFLGSIAAVTCVFAIICSDFPTRVEVLVPLMQTSLGLGLIMGPSIGGLLHQAGGFMLPFASVGCVCITLAVVAALIFPRIERVDKEATASLKEVHDWRFRINLLIVMACFLTVGLNEATLTDHLQQFGPSPNVVGLIFMISGLSYSPACFAFGQASKRVADPRRLCVIGSVCLLTSFTLIGPLPFVNLAPTVGLTCTSQFLLGLGMASHYVGTFMHSKKHLLECKRLPNNLSTFALLQGCFSSAIYLGLFAGPIIGGTMVDNVGYRWATAFVVFLQAAVLALLLLTITCDRPDPEHQAGKQPRCIVSNPGTQESIYDSLNPVAMKDYGTLSSKLGSTEKAEHTRN